MGIIKLSNLKISQLTSGTVSNGVVFPAFDPSQPAGSQNVKIAVSQLVQAGGTSLLLSGNPQSTLTLSPSSFSVSGGTLSVVATPITLSGTPITSFSPSTFTQSSGVLSANQPVITLSGTPITTFSPSSFSQSGGTLSITNQGSSLTLNGTQITGLDTNSFSQTGGILAVSQTAFSSLASGTLASSSQILIVNSGTAYQVTMAQLAAEISTLTAPSIAITAIGNQITANSFTVAGTLGNYNNPPNLFYEDNAGSFSALPSATITANSFSFTHPGIATGTYTLTIKDGNNVSATSNSFNVALATATNATISGAPSAGVAGTAISGATCVLTPSNATAYAVLMVGGADQTGGRFAFTGTSVPALTPNVSGTYVIALYAAASGGSPLVTSSNIAVTASVATAATIGTAPSTGTQGVAISGITDTLTPSNSSAYAVLALAGVDEGSRVAFTGTTLPGLTPQSTGSYTIKIYAALTGGSALATSTTITVSAALLTAATLSNVPANGTQGTAITGVTAALTPSNATAYAILHNGLDEGTRQLFTGTNVPSLTPQGNGAYSIEIYAALTGGTALATSAYISVAHAVATAATISGAPSTDTAGTPITGLTATLTPSYAQGWVCLNNGSDVLPRTSFTGTSIPSLTPATSGTFTVKIYSASTGGTALATSSSITVAGAAGSPPNLASGSAPLMRLDTTLTSNVTSDASYTTPQTTNGGVVEGLKDGIGTYNFNQPTSAQAPTLITNSANGKQGINFLASASPFMTGPDALGTVFRNAIDGANGTTGLTGLLVFRPTIIGDAQGSGTNIFSIGSQSSSNVTMTLYNNYGPDVRIVYNNLQISGSNYAFTPNSYAINNNMLLKVVFTLPGINTGNMQLFLNNLDVVTSGYDNRYDTNPFTPVTIGQNGAGVTPLDIYEFTLWPGVATGVGGATPTGDIATLMSYATTKYGS